MKLKQSNGILVGDVVSCKTENGWTLRGRVYEVIPPGYLVDNLDGDLEPLGTNGFFPREKTELYEYRNQLKLF